MQTELRVIDLGKREGKVVRRFFRETRPAYALTSVLVRDAYLLGHITRREAFVRHLEFGFRPVQAKLHLLIVDLVHRKKRKEVNHDRHRRDPYQVAW